MRLRQQSIMESSGIRKLFIFQSTIDQSRIKEIVTHPCNWPHLSDDFCSSPQDWIAPIDESFLYMLAILDGEIFGMWMFEIIRPILYKVHTALLPHARGPLAAIAAKEMAVWIWEHTECQRIITDVPENNPLARRFAEAAGMQQFGVNPKSYLNGGKLLDVIMLGLSRPVSEIVNFPVFEEVPCR
jgi:hypothetical protein